MMSFRQRSSSRRYATSKDGDSVSSAVWRYPPGITLRTCSAEDLVVLKTFAARGQDWIDVERVIVRQAGNLDWPHIRAHLRPLADLKEEPQLLEQLEQLRLKCER